MSKNFILTALAVLVVLSFTFFWYWREAIFSKEILRVEILSKDSAKIGEEIEYTVKYKNNGNFALENPKLIFELPENSLTEDSKTRFEQNLKDIYPGDENLIKFKGRLLGKEGDLKTAKAWLSYRPHNLSARYESQTTFTTKIDQVPVTLKYDLPSKIERGKEISYSINYFSNVDYPLENLSIKIEPLQGFNFQSADPISLDNSEWKLAILNKGQGGRIKIKGVISTDLGGNLNFSAKMGMWQDGVFIVVKEANQEIQTIQPLLFISQLINGVPNFVASPGQTLNYEIFLRNIGSTPFDNLFVISRIEGQALDLATLKSPDGQVKPNDNLIVFDSRQITDLQHIAPQQESKVTFSVKLKDNLDISGDQKNSLIIKNKVDASGISQEFDTKISSKLELAQKGYYSDFDGIKNEGTVPPQVGKTTTYTINWQIKNFLNDVKNVKVKAVLPQNVGLSDNIAPESQAPNFSFDSQSKEIVWLAGDLARESKISLSFQVALTPSLSQKGISAGLIGKATVFSEDQFTGSTIQSTAQAVTTNLPDDQANSGGGIVQ